MIKKEDLLIKFNNLLSTYPEEDKNLILNAYQFANLHHTGQKRASGEEYIIHPLSVAMILAEMNVDKEMVITGLLHDVVEDTGITLEELGKHFGEGVASLVDGVTKISKLKSSNKREQKAETIRKMLLAMTKDVRVIVIKFADKLHNMSTLHFLPTNKIKRIATETLEIYAPLAGKMGMNVIKNELENLAMKYLYPETFQIINDFIESNELDTEALRSKITRKISEKLEKLKIPFAIKSRTKHYYSIFRKMKKYDKKIDEIFDLYGIRIVTDTIENCYQIFGITHSLWQPIPGRFKDYIANPKKNGYKSLHTTVLIEKRKAVEIQIRTEEMDEFNEYGIAAHWYYKKGTAPKPEELDWLKTLMEVHSEKLSTEEYYQTIRDDILKDEIYVFTPNGDTIELPKNATPLDFAYKIHTEIGHRCRGAKANGLIIPLSYQLKNGMVVEILTAKEPNPKPAWLSIVKTVHARKKIKHYLTSKQQEDLKEDESQKKEDLKLQEKKEERLLRKISSKKSSSNPKITIEVNGEKNLLFSFAKCCNPTPQDKIVGFISRGRGIIIHRTDCKNIAGIKDFEERAIDVNWSYSNIAKNNIYSFFIKTLKNAQPFSEIGNVVQKYKGGILESSFDTGSASSDKIDGFFSIELPPEINIQTVLKEKKKIPSILFIDKR